MSLSSPSSRLWCWGTHEHSSGSYPSLSTRNVGRRPRFIGLCILGRHQSHTGKQSPTPRMALGTTHRRWSAPWGMRAWGFHACLWVCRVEHRRVANTPAAPQIGLHGGQCHLILQTFGQWRLTTEHSQGLIGPLNQAIQLRMLSRGEAQGSPYSTSRPER